MVKSYLRMPGPGLRRTIYRWRGTGGAGQIRCGPPMAKTPGGRQVSFRQSQIGDSAAMGIVKVASASRTAPTCWICSGVSSDTGSPRRTPSLGPNVQRRGHSPERWWTSVLGGAASTNRHWRNQAPAATWKGKIFGPGDCGLIGRCSCTSKRVAPTAVRKMLDRPGTVFRLSPNTAGMRQEHGPATEAALHGGAIKMARAVHHQVAVGVAAIGARAPKIRDGRNHSGGHAYRTIVTQASRGPPVHAHPSTGSRDRRTGT